jgi:hypothetical protein
MKKLLIVVMVLVGCETRLTPLKPPDEPPDTRATLSVTRPAAITVTDPDEEEEPDDDPDETDIEPEAGIAKENKFRWRYIVYANCGDPARRKFRYFMAASKIDTTQKPKMYYVLVKYWQKERSKIFDKSKTYQIQSYDYTAKYWRITTQWKPADLMLQPGKTKAAMPVTTSVFTCKCQ